MSGEGCEHSMIPTHRNDTLSLTRYDGMRLYINLLIQVD